MYDPVSTAQINVSLVIGKLRINDRDDNQDVALKYSFALFVP